MTGLLDTTDLADLRLDLEDTLPTTCTIAYVTRTADGMGGWTQSWTNRGTAITCRLSPAGSGYAGISAERLQEGQAWVLSLHHDQAIEVDDKVTVGGNEYRVLQINADESEIVGRRVNLVRWE